MIQELKKLDKEVIMGGYYNDEWHVASGVFSAFLGSVGGTLSSISFLNYVYFKFNQAVTPEKFIKYRLENRSSILCVIGGTTLVGAGYLVGGLSSYFYNCYNTINS